MTVILDNVSPVGLSDALLASPAMFGQITPTRCRIFARDDARVLQLDLAIDYQSTSATDSVGLHVSLVSEAFRVTRQWPPGVAADASRDGVALNFTPASSDELSYRVISVDAVCMEDSLSWPDITGSAPQAAVDYQPLEPCISPCSAQTTPFLAALQQFMHGWLDEQHLFNPSGLIGWVERSPVGYFGACKRHLLERSGKRDLVVDVTLLAQVFQAGSETRPDVSLYLYGERFGRLLLYRDQPKVIQIANKESQQVIFQENKEVLQAETADELIGLAGLGKLEKRLFKQADLLQPESLYASSQQLDALESSGSQSATELIDLGALDARSRNALAMIFKMAEQGQLSAIHLDLLHKVARQLSKPKR